jgi:hypothetical protein
MGASKALFEQQRLSDHQQERELKAQQQNYKNETYRLERDRSTSKQTCRKN